MKRLSTLAMLAAGCLRAGTPDIHDGRELEGFVDGLMEAQQKAYRFAGAVVTVVRDGTVVISKGYGYSDVAARKPVDPDRTLFRIASNSKMFVWTSVMQLVEQGKLDLHTDVNRYPEGHADSGDVPAAGHTREPDDAHRRVRGQGAGAVREEC